MNIILTTLNSKFIHSSLSIRYLKSYSEDMVPIELMEFTVNQNINYIVGEIYKKDPDIIGFSTYIWNREETLQICEILKIIKPELKIILGGPEVSFDGKNILRKHWFIDFIIYGEGEITFKELLKTLIDGKNDYREVNGIIYRQGDLVIQSLPRTLIKNLDSIPLLIRMWGIALNIKLFILKALEDVLLTVSFVYPLPLKGLDILA
ncbi:hypothetical protein CULT_1020007 [[Clostridium] ultunense Esp]|nr:hypothetical protein CULT_1020007 [[Clostridium] ultunense Esp]